MAFCVRLTELRTTYPAAIESDANRNVKVVVLGLAIAREPGWSDARKKEREITQLTEVRTSSCPSFISLSFFKGLESGGTDFAILSSL